VKPIVTSAQAGDAEAIAGLLEEMGRFYGGAGEEPLAAQLVQINEALFSSTPAAYALLAWDAKALVGIASYSFLWPALGLTRSLYLKELYVAASARRSGVGKLLMAGLFDLAAKHRCSRVEWTTDTSSQAAQEFYEEIGAKPSLVKIFYRSEL
jgi:GNAT superfamily N-acetyltransferase